MQQIFVSNSGNDENDGLTRQAPVRSWKRIKSLCKGNNEMFLMEGDATLMRLQKKLMRLRREEILARCLW